MLVVTIDASGQMLPSMLICKGATQGHIAREFSTYPDHCNYPCQQKGCLDNEMMNKWFDLVLIPWQTKKAPSVIPRLNLDASCAHMMETIVNWIQSLGIEVIHIPAGCTYLCQAVDVGTNKSIKPRIREKGEDFNVGWRGDCQRSRKGAITKVSVGMANWCFDLSRLKIKIFSICFVGKPLVLIDDDWLRA